MQRGSAHQLASIVGLIVLVSVTIGLAAWALTDAFAHPAAAVWWAFLRLTDPGYLGDDRGLVLRTLSILALLTGYVLFTGSLVAIMTQWLHRRMATLERGLTPIAARGHVVILGWTDRTPDLVRELVVSRGRVRRFLKRRGLRSLQLVILDEEITAARRHELAEHVGRAWDVDDIVLRSGSLIDPDDLARVDAMQAATLIIPAQRAHDANQVASDTRAVKALFTLNAARHASGRSPDAPFPAVVAEFMQSDSQSAAEALSGSALEAVASHRTLARLLVQTTRHPGLAAVYHELLSHSEGASLYVQTSAALDGRTAFAAAAWFPEAALLGVVRPGPDGATPYLNPPPDFTLAPDDRLVLMAHAYASTYPVRPDAPAALPAPTAPAPASTHMEPTRMESEQRILCLGWSARVAPLLREYGSYPRTRVHLTMLSTAPLSQRQALLDADAVPAHIEIAHRMGDYTHASVLRALDWAAYDTVLLLGSDRFASGEEADARTLMGALMAQRHAPQGAAAPNFVIELMDADNAPLLRDRPGDVIVPPALMSRMLAQITLRRELGLVLSELFGPDGAEIAFRPAARYGVDLGTSCTTRHLHQAVAACQETLLGIRHGPPRTQTLTLNPNAADSWTIGADTELVVLAADTLSPDGLHASSS